MNFQEAIRYLSQNPDSEVKRPCWSVNTLTLIDNVPTFLRDGEVSDRDDRCSLSLNTLMADDFEIVGTLPDPDSFIAYVNPATLEALRALSRPLDGITQTQIEVKVLA